MTVYSPREPVALDFTTDRGCGDSAWLGLVVLQTDQTIEADRGPAGIDDPVDRLGTPHNHSLGSRPQ